MISLKLLESVKLVKQWWVDGHDVCVQCPHCDKGAKVVVQDDSKDKSKAFAAMHGFRNRLLQFDENPDSPV